MKRSYAVAAVAILVAAAAVRSSVSAEEVPSPDHLPAGALPAEQAAELHALDCAGVDCPHCQTCQPGHEVCVYNFCPHWSVEAGVVFMHRSSPGLAPIFGQDGPFEGDVFESETEWNSGPQVKIGRNFRHLGRVELTHYGFYDSASEYLTHTVWEGPDSERTQDIISDYWSNLHSTELNVRRPLVGRMDWLAGFRWIEFEDRLVGFQVQSEFPDQGADTVLGSPFTARTYNHIYGFQLGVDGTLWQFSPNLRTTGFLKSGIYGDAISVRSLARTTLGGTFREREDFGHATFVGEMGVTGVYQINKYLSATAGYQGLWLEGVATLPHALSADRDRWTRGSPFFHGVVLGLEAAW